MFSRQYRLRDRRVPVVARHVAESLEVRCLLSAPEPNNTFAAASTFSNNVYLEQNYVNTDSVSKTSDTDDYYKFYTLYGASHLYASLLGMAAGTDADLYVYGQNQNLLASSLKTGNQSETINVDLPANQYFYVRVAAYTGATNYTLYLYNDYAGATTATARDLGVSWGQSSDKFWAYNKLNTDDYLDYRDNVDYFKFTMESAGTVSMRLRDTGGGGLTGSMQVLNSSGTVLTSRTGAFGGTGFNVFPLTVAAGTYYIKMTQTSGADPYTLRVTSDYAGANVATARNLGDLTNSTREEYDMVGTFDPTLASYDDASDIYKFTLSQATPFYAYLTVSQGLTPPTFDADLKLARDTNNDGQITSNEWFLQSNNNAGTGNDSIYTTLAAGTYYAVVVPHGAYTSYQLDLDSDLDQVPPTFALNNLTKAVNLGNLIGENYINGGLVGYQGDYSDYYKFTMTAAGKFTATATVNGALSRSTTPLTVQLLRDANNNGLFDTGEQIGGNFTSTVSTTLAAGTYYLRILNSAQQQAYYMRTLADYAGDLLTTARVMPAITGTAPATQVYQDYVEQDFGSNNDVNDVYKFTLPATYTTTLKTTGVAGEDLVLQLVKDANNNGNIDAGDVIAASDVLNSPNETIVKSLTAGTYYIRVHGVNGATNYTLSAAFAGAVTLTKLTGTTIGTAGSYGNYGNSNKYATDGSLTTFFDGPTANGAWVGLDLGAVKTIKQIAFAPRSGWGSRMVGGVIQVSSSANFTTGVTNVYTIAAAPATGVLTNVTLSTPLAARYIRYLSPNNGYCNIAEFQVFG